MGTRVAQLSATFGMAETTIYNWIKQDKIACGEIDGLSTDQALAFSQRVRDAGIAPSMGAVGTPADNAMIESFWGRMQVELFNRRRWKTRIELASAIHDYIEHWHNTRRRHSALGMLTPTEYENIYTTNNQAA